MGQMSKFKNRKAVGKSHVNGGAVSPAELQRIQAKLREMGVVMPEEVSMDSLWMDEVGPAISSFHAMSPRDAKAFARRIQIGIVELTYGLNPGVMPMFGSFNVRN